MLLLYKSMVRPHLEYAVHAWCPIKISDIKLLEGVLLISTLHRSQPWLLNIHLDVNNSGPLQDRH